MTEYRKVKSVKNITSNKEMILKDAEQIQDELHIELWYPGVEDNINKIVLGLMHVRASDSIRISYDFARNGWKIEQASIFEWSVDDEICDPDWQEVAFVQSWGRERKESKNDSESL